MMDSRSTADLIAALAADTPPAPVMRARQGAMWVTGGVMLVVSAVLMLRGFRIDAAMAAHLPTLVIANGLLLILAISAAVTALAMATPFAGARRPPILWALAMVAVLPLAAVVDMVSHGGPADLLRDGHGWRCLLASLVASVPVMAPLFLWVRRGAPVHPRLTAATIGTAGGAIGTMAYGLACPIGDMGHLFLWHAATPFITTALAAALLYRALKW